ncbi:MAG TPA: class I SAM-dependent methyltransferase [Clostridiales bacterium]|nr:class I SAM-dependent methyltransferase [Clostridiales bacterium]
MQFPSCEFCGNEIKKINNIWQLSDMPDIITDGEGDKYIGYENIGDSYSGNRKYLIEERDALFAKEVAKLTGDGVFLDLGCGDGCFTVPCASYGTKIIAGDISKAMLSILQEKAKRNHVSLNNVTLCRMNALDIPLEDESVDTVVCNSVLHLISNPQKVLSEIHRVLKKGGAFICKDDQPGRKNDSCYDNSKCHEIVNAMYSAYWAKLKERNIMPIKYSWKFDRAKVCDKLFKDKNEMMIERGNAYEIPLKHGFLPRFAGRGFSDQAGVPDEIHNHIIQELMIDLKNKFGDDFLDIVFKGIENNLLITVYQK